NRQRLRLLGIPALEVDHALGGTEIPVPVAWRNHLLRREDPLARLARERPLVATELDLMRSERDDQRKRLAGLSVEIQKKFSLPFACVVFVLIGAPLGMRVRRAGPAVAFVSILFFLFYYMCLVG